MHVNWQTHSHLQALWVSSWPNLCVCGLWEVTGGAGGICELQTDACWLWTDQLIRKQDLVSARWQLTNQLQCGCTKYWVCWEWGHCSASSVASCTFLKKYSSKSKGHCTGLSKMLPEWRQCLNKATFSFLTTQSLNIKSPKEDYFFCLLFFVYLLAGLLDRVQL